MTWNRKPVSYEEKGDRILSMPPEDRGLSGARDPTLSNSSGQAPGPLQTVGW